MPRDELVVDADVDPIIVQVERMLREHALVEVLTRDSRGEQRIGSAGMLNEIVRLMESEIRRRFSRNYVFVIRPFEL
ncbi:MAG: hypothetical protein KF774_17705 [Planctomyces sp.]|nr:hypothetical protein [Planctomyces sp.]